MTAVIAWLCVCVVVLIARVWALERQVAAIMKVPADRIVRAAALPHRWWSPQPAAGVRVYAARP